MIKSHFFFSTYWRVIFFKRFWNIFNRRIFIDKCFFWYIVINVIWFCFQNETQEAIPLEYLDEQIVISEHPTGSIQIKNEEPLDIKTEPEVTYDQSAIIKGENEDRDNDEEDDKPISELINFSKVSAESGNTETEVQKIINKEDSNEETG